MRGSGRAGGRLRALVVLLAAPLAGCVGSDGARAQGPEALEALLQGGEYGEAIERLERALGDPPAPEAAHDLAELLLTVGRLEESGRVLEDALAAAPGHPRLLLLRGRLLLETGRLGEALDALREAEAGGTGGDALLARMHAGEVLLRTGEPEAARELFDSFIDVYNRSAALDARGLVAVAHAVRRLEATDSALLQDALRAFDEALALDPDNLEAHLGIGSLFVRTYQTADAQTAFQEVLTRRSRDPRALLGIAEALQVEGSARAGELVDQALEVNPNLVPARVLRARIRFAAEDLEGAEEDLEAALGVDPTSSAARAVLAAMHFAEGRQAEFDAVTGSVLELNPHDAGYFVTVAELAATRRYYAEAAAFAARGAAVDPLAWSAYGTQGLNQLRVGEMAGGRENLETAFGGDPYNLWFKNTLDLLDVMEGFDTLGSERIQVFVDPEDGPALALYLLEASERAYESLSERYGFRPATPLRVEAFRRSADFSVRTVGLAGLGALGVAFGRVVAMDSPAARGPGGYHWASTLWHEMAHVVHLGMTGHRVPRWLSEGLAVHEERLAGPGWGSRPGLPFLASYLDGRLRPPSELSQSFVRPRFPEEIGFAYVLGSLVSEWVESEWGFAGIRGMLTGYGEGLSHREVLEREFGLGPEAFDEAFDEWVRERYPGGFAAAEAARELREVEEGVRRDPEWLEERVAARPEDVESRLALARIRIADERPEEAEELLREARARFPENPDPRGPSRLLAGLLAERGETAGAIGALEAHLAVTADDYGAHLELADLREAEGDRAGSARALAGALEVYPFEIPVHERLAGLYRELGEAEAEVRERRVILALAPVDRTGALYELAEALYRAGEVEEARERVLEALELAPLYPEAQDLLLRLMTAPGGR